jgi:hypothetical protein
MEYCATNCWNTFVKKRSNKPCVTSISPDFRLRRRITRVTRSSGMHGSGASIQLQHLRSRRDLQPTAMTRLQSTRKSTCKLARLELDRLSGLPNGYSGKLLSKNPRKNIGIASLGPLLESLGLVICVLENPAARDATLARRAPFDASNRRVGNRSNPKKSTESQCALPALVESPRLAKVDIEPRRTEPVSRAHLHVVQPLHKGPRWGGAL